MNSVLSVAIKFCPPYFLKTTYHLNVSGIIMRMQTDVKNIIGVRFTPIGKIYHFDSSSLPDLKQGEHVIVDTTRGRHLGEVVQILQEAPPKPEGGWKSVERRATPRNRP